MKPPRKRQRKRPRQRPRKRIDQGGGIVVRRENARTLVLLVRSKKDPSIWVYPKGHIEPGETAVETAVRETYEESGVRGESLGPIGAPLEFQSGHEPVRVQYFLIRPTSEVDSPEGREKGWFTLDEARQRLAFENARALLKLVPNDERLSR